MYFLFLPVLLKVQTLTTFLFVCFFKLEYYPDWLQQEEQGKEGRLSQPSVWKDTRDALIEESSMELGVLGASWSWSIGWAGSNCGRSSQCGCGMIDRKEC